MGFNENLGKLDQSQLEQSANEQFGETPALLASSLADLRNWISKSPHLHSIQQDEKILKTFLRGCKFSLERTKEKLDLFHAVKGSVPEWFGNWDTKDAAVQEVLQSGVYLPLPGYDKQGRFVILCRIEKINPAKVNFDSVMRAAQMIITTAINDDEQTIIKGFVIISDLKGAGVNHVTMFNLASLKKMITMMETAWPLKPKAEHILNMPGIMENMHKMVKSMQKKKMQERTHVHLAGDLSGLQQDVGVDILPVEYGGSNGTLEELKDYWIRKVEDNKEKLMELSKFKTDEAKRPGKPKLHAELFGIEGSFRKLEID